MCEGPAILHGTDDWLVVDKPVGWHTTGGSGASERPDLEAWLRERVNSSVDLHEAGLVHRLDLFTGGCVLVATNERTRTLLREAMSGRGDIAGAIGKVYLAQTTRDVPERGQFELSFTNRYKRSKKVTVSESGSDKSMGSCRWRNGCDGVIEVQLRGPGRRHQIRAGMAFCGFPLIGDALYGGYVNDASDQVPEDAGPRLHAWRLYVGDDIVESPRPQWASPSND